MIADNITAIKLLIVGGGIYALFNLVLAGYTQSEIAKSLDTSRQNVKIILNTVKNRMHLRPQ